MTVGPVSGEKAAIMEHGRQMRVLSKSTRVEVDVLAPRAQVIALQRLTNGGIALAL